ncbi:MAG TPA: condensation domain-containing protein, partial [Pyrinomonadaceae bacterium]|nr:condensation domain-containing protein [Pyrinomonadaceae bacterium]
MENKVIEGFCLSPQQQRLWQLSKQDGAERYCARCAFMLDGDLDVHTLQRAFEDVVARHEIFRTRLETFPGMRLPLQVIDEDVNVAIDMELLPLAPNKHLLSFSLPPFCADGPSLRNLMKDLGQAYKARRDGETIEDEPMQYADFAGWQNDLLESTEAEVGKLYWRKRDLSETAALKLPFERSSSSAPGCVGYSEEQTLEFATINDEVLLAAMYTLLWRLTGQTDLLIGVAHDGRRYEELKSVIGPVAKYLPVACAVDDVPFRELVERVQQAVDEARQWQDVFTYEPDEFIPFVFEYTETPEPYRVGDLQFSMYRE